MDFRVTTDDFKDNGEIPKKFTCDGENSPPELQWEGAPPGTKSFTLIVEDPDAPGGTFVHWVLYDVPASASKLPSGMKAGGTPKEGRTGFGQNAWGGPCPPKGHGTHRYFFILKAIDVATLGLKPGATKAQVEEAMKGHVLAETKIMGTYKR